MTSITTNEPIDGISWTIPLRRSYPYVSRDVDLESYNDPYQRNVASLLASIASFCMKVDVSNVRDIRVAEIKQIGRICNNEMTVEDYAKYFDSILESLKTLDDKSTILHLNLLELDETSTNRSIPNLQDYEHIILSSYSSTGKVTIFLILPAKSTVNAYSTTIIPFEEVKDTLKQLLKLLSTVFGKAFTVQLRLQVPESFHPDPLFTALFLIATIYQRGKYLKATETSIMKYKLWMIRDFISEHDQFLGKLDGATVNIYSYPFQTPHRPQDKYTLLEKKGWQVMDVAGDGNCGYYSLFLGLQNIGINDYQINTEGDSRRVGLKRWQQQVIALRQHLKQGSNMLSVEVFPSGSPNRSLDWWFNDIGVVTDDDVEELSDSFLIPNTGPDEEAYFHRSFTENEDMHRYHIHPYWAPLVFSYLYGVRVVVITRTTKPKENATKPTHLIYVHTTKIYDFNNDEFQKDQDTYVPVTSYEKCVRLSDASFNSKPTIELLYLTGYKFSHIDKNEKVIRVKDDNHFLFLRRVLCVRIPPHLPLPEDSLRKAIIEEQQPQSEANTMEETSVPSVVAPQIPPQPDNPAADQANTMEETSVAHVVAAEIPPQPDNPAADMIDAVNDEILEVAHDPTLEGNTSFRESQSNHHSANKRSSKKGRKKSEKQVHKKKQHPKVSKERETSVLPANDDNDNENQSIKSNIELADNLLYDADTQSFFTARFDNSLKRYLDKTLVEDITTIDQDLLNNARNEPNNWVSLPLGSSCDQPPPVHLTTTVKCLYEQLDRPYCVTYCMASALFYCGFGDDARQLAEQASLLAPLHRMAQIESLRDLMPNLVPLIGGHTVLGKRCMGNKKKKRKITWSDLFETMTPYPTLVVPVTEDGKMNHAFCIVDDLIFDSSVPYALKLVMASVEWIYNYQPVEIFVALRFHQKVSPKGHKVRGTYTRPVERNWTVVNESISTGHRYADSLFNKAYDVEYIAQPNISKAIFTTNY